MIALLLALFITPTHEAQVVPETLITTPDFDAVWVPEGVTGPIVAAAFSERAFETSGE
jgi:hypothetical protein